MAVATARSGLVVAQRRALTQDEIDAALLDPCIFTDSYCKIRGKGGRTEPFRLWDYQFETMEAMDDEQRLLVLKARQLGISWLADAYALWLCTANEGQTVLILSKGLSESQEELTRVKFMHRRLPPELKCRTGNIAPGEVGKDNTSTLEFPEMDSRIISLPSTEHAGTSYTATLVIIHELAKIANAHALMAAVTPTIGDEGRMFLVSTAKGFSGVFFDKWNECKARWHTGQVVGDVGEPGDFRPVFIPWHARPGRTQAWYDSIAKTLSGKEMRQEYPATPQEAFQGSTDAVFGEEFDRHGVLVLDATREQSNHYAVVVGTDPGVNHAYAYLIEVQGRVAFVFAEVHIENGAVEDLGKAISEALVYHGLDPAECMVYMDPFDVGRNLQTLKTDLDVLGEQGLLVDREDERYTPSQRVGTIKVLLKTERLYISEDCPDLLDALERAPWATRRIQGGEVIRLDTYAKDGKYEHPLDALGTALARLYPPLEAAAIDTEPAAVATAMSVGYSGSEFG